MAAHSLTIIVVSGGQIRGYQLDEAGTGELWPGLAPDQIVEEFLPTIGALVKSTAVERVADSVLAKWLAAHLKALD